jgi:hypothetical protein
MRWQGRAVRTSRTRRWVAEALGGGLVRVARRSWHGGRRSVGSGGGVVLDRHVLRRGPSVFWRSERREVSRRKARARSRGDERDSGFVSVTLARYGEIWAGSSCADRAGVRAVTLGAVHKWTGRNRLRGARAAPGPLLSADKIRVSRDTRSSRSWSSSSGRAGTSRRPMWSRTRWHYVQDGSASREAQRGSSRARQLRPCGWSSGDCLRGSGHYAQSNLGTIESGDIEEA